jgi:hypothetical protein
MRRCLADAERRVDLATATLGGFHSGIALVADVDGGTARFEVGARLRIEVADATAVATVDEVVHHDGPVTPDRPADPSGLAPVPPDPPGGQGTQLRLGEEHER